MKAKVNEALKAHFRPEFLNRIDEVIVFHELTREEVIEIVDLMLARTRPSSWPSQGLGLELTPAARTLLAEQGLRPASSGARPLAPGHPAARRGPALRADPLEGVPGRRDDHRRRGTPSRRHRRGPRLSFRAVEGVEPPPMELAGSGAE